MTENVQMVLIIAGAVAVIVGIAVFVLKDKLRSGNIKVNRGGVETHGRLTEPPVTKISGTKISGAKNEICASDGAQVENSEIAGDKNKLSLRRNQHGPHGSGGGLED